VKVRRTALLRLNPKTNRNWPGCRGSGRLVGLDDCNLLASKRPDARSTCRIRQLDFVGGADLRRAEIDALAVRRLSTRLSSGSTSTLIRPSILLASKVRCTEFAQCCAAFLEAQRDLDDFGRETSLDSTATTPPDRERAFRRDTVSCTCPFRD